MSRSKKDILDTERMLERLRELLAQHHVVGNTDYNTPRRDAEALRRISMTLHNWHELECGDSNENFSRAIVRGFKSKVPDLPSGYAFHHDDNGAAYLECHDNKSPTPRVQHFKVPDREAGALKRLKAIMARYPALQAYVQTDPRGCALYILKPGDVPDGADVSSYYSRGLAVYR